jgi:hypothetical protein
MGNIISIGSSTAAGRAGRRVGTDRAAQIEAQRAALHAWSGSAAAQQAAAQQRAGNTTIIHGDVNGDVFSGDLKGATITTKRGS